MTAKLPIKKMITELLFLTLILPLHVTLFAIRLQFRYVMKMMVDVESILSDDEFYVDTPKECVEQQRKQEHLKGAVSKGKLLNGKKKKKRDDRASSKTIIKAYAEHKQCGLNEKGEKNWKSLR